jgi:hypothetical protein
MGIRTEFIRSKEEPGGPIVPDARPDHDDRQLFADGPVANFPLSKDLRESLLPALLF